MQWVWVQISKRHQFCRKQPQMFGDQGGKVTLLLGMFELLTDCTTRARTALMSRWHKRSVMCFSKRRRLGRWTYNIQPIMGHMQTTYYAHLLTTLRMKLLFSPHVNFIDDLLLIAFLDILDNLESWGIWQNNFKMCLKHKKESYVNASVKHPEIICMSLKIC